MITSINIPNCRCSIVAYFSTHICIWELIYAYIPQSSFMRTSYRDPLLVCDLNRTPVVMAKRGGSCVHFSGISTCGRTSRETVSHPQRPPLPTLYKISLPVYIIVANKRLQPLTKSLYNSMVLSFSLLTI